MQEQTTKNELENEANQRKTAWSCNDDIKNGDETGIDCGGTYCSPCSTVGIDNLNLKNGVKIYPNPLMDKMFIESNEMYHLTIKNMEGKIIRETEINKGLNTIQLEELPAGIYVIEGLNSYTRFVEKVIVK